MRMHESPNRLRLLLQSYTGGGVLGFSKTEEIISTKARILPCKSIEFPFHVTRTSGEQGWPFINCVFIIRSFLKNVLLCIPSSVRSLVGTSHHWLPRIWGLVQRRHLCVSQKSINLGRKYIFRAEDLWNVTVHSVSHGFSVNFNKSSETKCMCSVGTTQGLVDKEFFAKSAEGMKYSSKWKNADFVQIVLQDFPCLLVSFWVFKLHLFVTTLLVIIEDYTSCILLGKYPYIKIMQIFFTVCIDNENCKMIAPSCWTQKLFLLETSKSTHNPTFC